MKNTQLMIGLLAIAAALSSCSVKEDYSLYSDADAPRFRAVLEQSDAVQTKVYVDQEIFNSTGRYSIFWYKDDRVSIFYDDTYNHQYKFLGRDGNTAGEFEVIPRSGYTTAQPLETGYSYSIFPYNYDNACDTEGKLTVVIPEKQEYYSPEDDYRGIGARLLMVAVDVTGEQEFVYKHVGCYIGVRLMGDGVSVKSITLRGNNSETIAGYPIVQFDENQDPVMHFDPRDRDNSKSITMELSDPVELNMDDYTYFWLIVPPITFEEGFTLTVEDSEGGSFVKEYSSSVTLKRKAFYTLSLTVDPSGAEAVAVESVSLDPEELSLNVGEEETLTATVLPEDATNKSVSWSSSNEEVATVDQSGKVTAVAAGTAVITVTTTDGEKEASCTVTVSDVLSYSLAIAPDEASILIGGTQTYAVTLTTVCNGVSSESEATGAVLTVSDPETASVSGFTVTGLKEGSVTVTATFIPEDSEELSAVATLTVSPVAVESVSLDPEELSLNVGEEETLTATVLPEDATDPSVSWSSNDTSVATVDESGKVTAVAAGTAVITVTTTDGEKEASCTVTVSDVVSYSLAITPAEAEILIGGTQTYAVTLTTVRNGVSSESEATGAVLTVSNSETASVSGLTVTGLKEGTVTVTAKFTPEDSEELSAVATLTVSPVAVSSVSLNKTDLSLNVGEEETLTATVLPEDATDKSVSWSSNDTSVATVDQSGKVTAVAAGTAVITVTTTDGGLEASCTVTVSDVVSYSLAITPAEAEILLSGTQAYVVTLTTVRNGVSSESEATGAVLTVSNSETASVSGLTVTGLKEGTVTVTAKFTPEGSEELSAVATLTVSKEPNHAGDPVEVEDDDF